ncbi:MAG: Maf family protein [Clostridia bacterium]|nr:Maf family protein [Clostridia bacterium]
MRIVLASASPRRAKLLAKLGFPFEIVAPECDESLPPGIAPAPAVKLLARRKAETVAARMQGEALVIAADTLVYCDGEFLGKPTDVDHSGSMLLKLSGKKHEVYTGVCMLNHGKNDLFAEKTTVWFEEIPQADLDKLARDGLDKAGAYGIQGLAGAYISRINGSYDNVVGLPLAAIRRKLANGV